MKSTFYDINKLPQDFGILVFPISLVRADNKAGQDPAECLEYIKHFSPAKVSSPKIGLNMIYGDFLYLYSSEEGRKLKTKFMNITLKHKKTFERLLTKERERFQIQHAFSYSVWNQLYLSYQGDFASDFSAFKDLYNQDPKFQRYVQEDADYCKRELTEDQLNFFLEEHLILYLISKKRMVLPNEYIQGREQWVLWCYPGLPLKGQVYTYQLNPLQLETPENVYQNHFYDLQTKKLVDAMKLDLDTYDYSY